MQIQSNIHKSETVKSLASTNKTMIQRKYEKSTVKYFTKQKLDQPSEPEHHWNICGWIYKYICTCSDLKEGQEKRHG